jgi:hypothetical protein
MPQRGDYDNDARYAQYRVHILSFPLWRCNAPYGRATLTLLMLPV